MRQVAEELTAKDVIRAHARDELGALRPAATTLLLHCNHRIAFPMARLSAALCLVC